MNRLIISLTLLLLCTGIARAQTPTVGAVAVEFTSADHAAVLSDGTPAVTGYQGIFLSSVVDPVSGPTLQVGNVVPKTTVTAGTGTGVWRLTFGQLGITVPPCTVAQTNCPAYRLVLLSIGPNGSSVRAVTSASAPFSPATTAAPPAGPTNVRVVSP